MDEMRFTEDEIVAAYAEIEGTDTGDVRALRACWRARYGEDFKELRCQNTIAQNWLNMKRQLLGLNSDIAAMKTELAKRQATIDFQRGEMRRMKTEAETTRRLARDMMDEAFRLRTEAAQMKGEAEERAREAEEMMRTALERMAQTTESALKKELDIGCIVSELRENMRALFIKAKDSLHLKENMKQQALSLFSTMYDVLVEKQGTGMVMTKEDFMRLMCYIFGYEQKHPLQALSTLRQRGGEMQIFGMLTEVARGMKE